MVHNFFPVDLFMFIAKYDFILKVFRTLVPYQRRKTELQW